MEREIKLVCNVVSWLVLLVDERETIDILKLIHIQFNHRRSVKWKSSIQRLHSCIDITHQTRRNILLFGRRHKIEHTGYSSGQHKSNFFIY